MAVRINKFLLNFGRACWLITTRLRSNFSHFSCYQSLHTRKNTNIFKPCYWGPHFVTTLNQYVGRDSSVGIATGYGLDGPGIESRWDEIFRTCPDRPWGPPSLLYNRYRVFTGGKEWPGREADPSPPSSTEVKEE
jgi:hypothetical protein